MNNKRDGAATRRAVLEPQKPDADPVVPDVKEARTEVVNQRWQTLVTPWYQFRGSDQATKLLRFIPQTLFRYVCYSLGLSLLVMLGGALLREQFPWFDNLLNNVFGKDKRPLGYLIICLQFMSLYGQFYLCRLMYNKWTRHVYKRDLTNHTGVRFFWDEPAKAALEQNITDPQTRAAVWSQKRGTFFTKGEGWKPLPVATETEALTRGFNTVGMSAAAFVWKELTVGMLYPLTALKRIFLNRWGFQVGAREAHRHEMYLGVQNSAFGTFVSPESGHIVIRNLELPFAQTSTMHFEKFEIHLNHDTKEVNGVTLEYFPLGSKTTVIDRYGFADGANTPVLPPADESQMTAMEKQALAAMIAQEQLHQCALLCLTVAALYSHSAIHWWANGVALINQNIWPAAQASVNITQWMNSQSVFFAWFFFGNTQDVFGTFLARNAANGLPLHQDKPAFYTMAVSSNLHRMAAIVRRKLLVLLEQQKLVRDPLEILPQECDPEVKVLPEPLATITTKEIDCLVAATVMHAADHYYMAKHFPLFGHGNCLSLQTDISGLIQSLVKPVRFPVIKLRVSQHLTSADLRSIETAESHAAAQAYHAKWIALTTCQQQMWIAPNAETRQQLREQIEQLSGELRELDQADIQQILQDGRTDPVSYIIYRECREVEADFADNALCVGCAV